MTFYLSQVGHARIHKGEPVRMSRRNGKLAATRQGSIEPFNIIWSDGETVTYAVDAPEVAQIKYCPDMNIGQEYVMTVYALYKDDASRMLMMAMYLAQLGKDESLTKEFDESIRYMRKHADDL